MFRDFSANGSIADAADTDEGVRNTSGVKLCKQGVIPQDLAAAYEGSVQVCRMVKPSMELIGTGTRQNVGDDTPVTASA